MPAQTWKCVECARTVEAIATEVSHRCPANRLRVTAFRLVREVTAPKGTGA
jgi:hypothetical protein